MGLRHAVTSLAAWMTEARARENACECSVPWSGGSMVRNAARLVWRVRRRLAVTTTATTVSASDRVVVVLLRAGEEGGGGRARRFMVAFRSPKLFVPRGCLLSIMQRSAKAGEDGCVASRIRSGIARALSTFGRTTVHPQALPPHREDAMVVDTWSQAT